MRTMMPEDVEAIAESLRDWYAEMLDDELRDAIVLLRSAAADALREAGRSESLADAVVSSVASWYAEMEAAP